MTMERNETPDPRETWEAPYVVSFAAKDTAKPQAGDDGDPNTGPAS